MFEDRLLPSVLKRCFWGFFISHLMMCAVGLLWGQNTSAEIQGSVHDERGDLIPNAVIAVTNARTSVARTTTSNHAGVFNVPDLPPSEYTITVSASGFAPKHVTNLNLTVGAHRILQITLTPAVAETVVEVKADAADIDLANSSLSGVEDATTIQELPLNGRDWTQLALLQPGVAAIRTQNTLNGSSSNRGSRGFGSEVTIGGGRPTQNNYFLDGISLNDYTNGAPGTTLGLALGADGIQEFSVLTNNYDATYGGTSGGVINAVSRSGSNVVHGDVYEFLRNDILDARNFFDGLKLPFRRNQFGTAMGGPLNRNKTFFFSNYEGLRQALSTTTSATVPSAQARTGDLSTGKIIVSPAVIPFLALWPLPNRPLLGTSDIGQYIFTATSRATENFGLIKLDHLITKNDNLLTSWSTDEGQVESPDALNAILVHNSLWRNTGVLSETHIFGRHVVGVFRAGINRVAANGLSASPGNNPAASDPALGVLPGRDAPALSVPGLTSFVGGTKGTAAANFWFTNLQLYGDLNIEIGKHSMKAGVQFIHYRYNTQVASDPNGAYNFASLPDFLSNRTVASFFADVLYPGNQGAATATGFPERGFRQNVAGFYFQDNFRLKTNLTMNIGLRYETSSVPTEVHGLLSNLRDIYTTDLNIGKPLFQNPTRLNLEPRVGFAYDPFRDGKTSLRAGFGLFDVLPLIYQIGMLEAYSGPFSSLLTLVNPPVGSFPDGGYNAILRLDASHVPVREPSIEYNPSRNYVMQWNASLQRALTRDLALLIAYAGSRGIHMSSMANDADIVLPTYTAQGYSFPSPVGSGTRLNPSVGSIRQLTWGDSSNYNSLQVRLRKKLSRGFQIQGSLTWQKSIDGYSSSIFPTQFQNSVSTLYINRHLNRGPSDFNTGRVGTINGVWYLPKLNHLPTALRVLTNGWDMEGIFTTSDGLPFTPVISGDAAGENSASSYDVPNRVTGPACTHLTNRGNPSNYINLSCYSFPAPATVLGNAGRNSLSGPGLLELDSAVHRDFSLRSISETAKLQFRAEVFNVTNRANFEPPLPNNALYDSKGTPLATAGVITSTATTSRQIQVALRFSW